MPQEPQAKLSPADLIGHWQLRIDAGGEIYRGKFQITEKEGKLVGTYESDEGRRTKITQIELKSQTVRIETQTQRFSVPVTAVFIADVADHEMQGEADYSSGSRSRTYTFRGKRKKAPTGGVTKRKSKPPGENSTAANEQILESESESVTTTFRQGQNGYDQLTDVEVWAIAPDKPLHRQGTLTSDGNNGGGESQVLMRFDGIFGNQQNQIPHNATIESATLRVVAFDPGTTVYVHRLLVPWNASTTWNRLGNGISIDNFEASTVRDGFTFGQINMDRQSVEFDVTQTVQHWADGEPNFGWVFVNTGSNGWDFYSADWHEVELRPTLFIQYRQRDNRGIQMRSAGK